MQIDGNTKSVLKTSLEKALYGIDLRLGSETFGVADREYWAWKTKDFANGTHQACLFPLLILGQTFDYSEQHLRRITDAILKGTRFCQRGNGSFEEAFPFESSYAVTGLVLSHLLAASILRPEYFSTEASDNLKAISVAAYKFLIKTKETHGVISNHVMSTALALDLHEKLFQSSKSFRHTEDLCKSIHPEGWFVEYEGADPGYQTLLNHYLALSIVCGSNQIETLNQSVNFCSYFKFPDGSFAGEIGSRLTGVAYPSGLMDLKGLNFDFNWYFQNQSTGKAVTPLTIDIGNFVPLLSSWGLFHFLLDKYQLTQSTPASDLMVNLENAGQIIKKTPDSLLAINTRTGVYKLVNKDKSEAVSYWIKGTNNYISKVKKVDRNSNSVHLTLDLYQVNNKLNNLFSAVLLRVIGMMGYLLPLIMHAFKKILASYVMKSLKPIGEQIELKFTFNDAGTAIEIINSKGFSPVKSGTPLHMASANYKLTI